jgi:hypothetical protein
MGEVLVVFVLTYHTKAKLSHNKVLASNWKRVASPTLFGLRCSLVHYIRRMRRIPFFDLATLVFGLLAFSAAMQVSILRGMVSTSPLQ